MLRFPRASRLLPTIRLLLIAGHESTVNLITSGVLTLLHHPDILERFCGEPELGVTMFEELVRYEPSVQFRHRVTLADIEIAGTTIPLDRGTSGYSAAFKIISWSRIDRFPPYTPCD